MALVTLVVGSGVVSVKRRFWNWIAAVLFGAYDLWSMQV